MLGLLLLISLSIGSAQAQSFTRSKNGVRLVLESGPRGRLEISTKDTYFPYLPSNSKNPVWMPVCLLGFSNEQAEAVCQLLGYKHGWMYGSPAVTAPVKPITGGFAAMAMYCQSTSSYAFGHRRHLRAASSAAEAADADAALVPVVDGGSGGNDNAVAMRKRTLSYRRFNVAVPAKAPYACTFFLGSCGTNGPFAGVECSNTAKPPAPPLPPSPPRPPVYEDHVRLIGGSLRNEVEGNLCGPQGSCGRLPSRVEMRMPSPEGNDSYIWAPVCHVEGSKLREVVARAACQQAYGWPSVLPLPPIMVLASSSDPFDVPQETDDVAPGDFNPSTIPGWATITDLKDVRPTMLQSGNVTVSEAPCESLLAVKCTVLWVR